MKKLIVFLSLILILAACSPPAAPQTIEAPTPTPITEAPPPTASPEPLPDPTETPVPVEPTATNEPPTAVPPTATAVIPTINIDTTANLYVTQRFGEGELLRDLAFSPQNNLLASAGGNTEDFVIRIWDVNTGNLLYSLDAHTNIVWSVTFSPDGKWLVSTSGDGTAKVWDVAAGTLEKELDIPDETSISSSAFSPDGKTVAVGGTNGFPDASIWTFSVPDWQPQLKLDEFWNIPEIAFSPDGSIIAGGGTSRNARTWNADDGSERAILNHAGQVSSLTISPDGTTIAAGLCVEDGGAGTCAQSEIWLWDLETGTLNAKISAMPDWIEKVKYTVDGSLLIVGARSGNIVYYETQDYTIHSLTSSPGGGGAFTLSNDGRFLATTGQDGLILIWAAAP